MKYIANIYLFLLMTIMACEQIVEIDIPEHKSQLVLSSFYEAGDSKITAYLTKSVAILDDEDPDDVWGATVNLYENDVLVGQLEEGFDTIYTYQIVDIQDGELIYGQVIDNISHTYLLKLPTPLQQGNTYKITAEAPDYNTISATQKMLTPPTVSDVTYHSKHRPNLEGVLLDAVKLKLHDASGRDDYYEFRVHISVGSGITPDWFPRWTESYTPGVDKGREGSLLLNDNLFEGNVYDVELLMSHEDTTYVDFLVEVNSISRDKYLFYKSLKAYEDALYNPFAEPVIVHTNVENGQGIFSIENKTEVLVE